MNPRRSIWALVPVKLLDRSKGRLSPLLSGEERRGLARAMLVDVLDALQQSHGLAGVMVVTGDEDVATIARARNAEIMIDHGSAGMSQAVAMAARHLHGMPDTSMLVVPADVPRITPQDVATIIEAHGPPPAVTLVAAERDGGTNLLLCTPPEAIPFHYGEGSCARHQQAARARGITRRTMRIERAGLDLDRPEDIADFMRLPSATRTYAWLVAHGIGERLRVLSTDDASRQPTFTS
ncbi:MAG: 2-phospho-L-lactate guanylyltransferase [Betaproteobacteria bacterium]